MDWKKVIGPWDFKKSQADTKYNEETHIATKENPVWIIPQSCGRPITIHHTPCGYWLKEYASPEILTSELYPLEAEDYIDSSLGIILTGVLGSPKFSTSDYVDSSGDSIIVGNLVKAFFLREYSWEEYVDSSGATITEGELVADFVLVEYDVGHEDVDSSGASILSGNLEDVLIKYADWPEESINSAGATITEGNLE